MQPCLSRSPPLSADSQDLPGRGCRLSRGEEDLTTVQQIDSIPMTPPRQAPKKMTLPLWIDASVQVVRQNRRPYIVLNVLYYGAVAVAMIVVAGHPEVQQALTGAVLESFTEGGLSTVFEAYAQGSVLQAMGLTFAVNFFLGSILVLFIPSLLVPFSGVAIGLTRATLWGLILAPTTPELRIAMIPHTVTLLLEGQGYVLAMLASLAMGKGFLSPSSMGVVRWRDSYVLGFKDASRIYILVAMVLAIAAIYEALEVIYLVPRLLS